MSVSEFKPTPPPAAPEPAPTPVDTGSQALEEALKSSFFIVKILMVIMVGFFIFSGVRTVGPQERALRFRFGAPVGTGQEQLLGPGFHWAWPYPIEEIKKIPVGEILSINATASWYGTTPEMEAAGRDPDPRPSMNPGADGYVITGDGNILHVRAMLRYRIKDPLAYEFDFVSASNALRSIVNNAIIAAAARSTVDDVLLNNTVYKERVLADVNAQVDALKLGVTLEPLDVKVIAPAFLKPAFEEVTSVAQASRTMIENARGAADAALAAARGEANSLVNIAQADKTRYVQAIEAEAKAFTTQLPQYQANPDLFRQRLLVESWQNVLTNAADKFFLPQRADGHPRELRLNLNREPESRGSIQSPVAQ